MSRRLPGATDSERLTLSTIKDSDQLTTRHNPGILDDVDLGTAKKILQATPVFACTSAAATAAKTAFLQDSFPDFELVNGRTIIVYMANANTAANPTLNVQYTDAIPLDGDYWQAGTFIKCQYVDITVNGNRIRRWVMDQGANNVKAQLNGALASYSKIKFLGKSSNTIVDISSLSDGKYIVMSNMLNATFAGYELGVLEVTHSGGIQSRLNVFSRFGSTVMSSDGYSSVIVNQYSNGLYCLQIV